MLPAPKLGSPTRAARPELRVIEGGAIAKMPPVELPFDPDAQVTALWTDLVLVAVAAGLFAFVSGSLLLAG